MILKKKYNLLLHKIVKKKLICKNKQKIMKMKFIKKLLYLIEVNYFLLIFLKRRLRRI